MVTIVSDKSQQRDRLDPLKSFLRKQNYPETLIENGIDRAIKKSPITDDSKPKNKENVIPLVTTFNPCNTNVLPFICACEKVLQKSDRMKHILNKSSIINSKRQPKNLKRILMSSKFDYISLQTKVSKCGDKRCKICPDLTEGTEISFNNGKRFEVKRNMNFKIKYVVYTLTCSKMWRVLRW